MSNEKREQQIVEAGKTAAEGKEFSVLVNKQRRTMSAYEIGFIEGAEWADQHPAWVSVEERLPEENGWYLVATPTLNSKIDVALWDGKWRRLITITHWMQLPKLPVKKGGEK